MKLMFFILIAAMAAIAFSFVSDAELTRCAGLPLLKVTGWCGIDTRDLKLGQPKTRQMGGI
jgi:hypothetical protein